MKQQYQRKIKLKFHWKHIEIKWIKDSGIFFSYFFWTKNFDKDTIP